jgi:hypothetical protein
MLLFDDSKRLEKALGEEAASAIAHALEQAEDQWRQDLATKADVQLSTALLRNEISGVRTELKEDNANLRISLANTKNELLRWTITALVAQTALIATIMALLK